MMKKFLLLSVAAVLAGCFGKVIETSYYQLDYVPTPQSMTRENPYMQTLRIKDFEVSEAYRRNNIVYRQSPYELHFYNYEQWAVKPEYLVADMLFAHFNAAKIFTAVKRGVDSEDPDFVVSGTIRALEEYDNQDEWYAHLAMSMNLTDNKSRQVLWSREWNYRKKVGNQEPVFVVRALSELLERINNEAVADIDSVVSEVAQGAYCVVPQATANYAQPRITDDTPNTKNTNDKNTDNIIFEKLPPPEEIK
ncbi:hypothetical protein AGMMS49938_16220 [Fibrobacterales bacterium]|nr:hypothetical protein AGMMS49938_16220 [Fibrobacterales bacterium]